MAKRPCGNAQESKKYIFGNHKLYGWKTEASVLPKGIAMLRSFHVPRVTSDIEFYRNMYDLHKPCLRKRALEKSYEDDGPLRSVYEDL